MACAHSVNALEEILSNILSLLAFEIQLKLLICYVGRYRDSSYATCRVQYKTVGYPNISLT
jgi:hypothetical protein